MNFLAPGAFFLGLLLPIIIALYLLKLRRIEREVPSTFLWRKMVRDVEANAPWQRLRPNLLMILQLLFLIALIIALARPFSWSEGVSGNAAIFIIDSSASMSATDVQPSRIESAKARAIQLINDLPGSARVTVIEAGKEARVLASSSLDRRQAHLAVQGIQAGTSGTDMNVALELASAIAARQPGTEIVVLSDGKVELPQRITLKGQLRYIPFGLDGENQAVSLLTLEPVVSKPTQAPTPGAAPNETETNQQPTTTLTAFAQVSNYGEKYVSRRLSLYADGQLINAFDITDIPSGGQKSVIAEGLSTDIREIEARLDGGDIFPLDDSATAVKPDTQPLPALLVSPGNLFLETALTLMPGVSLTVQTSGAESTDAGTPEAGATPSAQPTATATITSAPATTDGGSTALTIYDNTIPDTLPESGSLLFIAPPRSTDFFTTTGLAESPVLRVIDPEDPLVANAALTDVSVLDAVEISLPVWATPVVAGDIQDDSGNTTSNIPLIFRGEVNGRRIAVIAFDLRHSDLPLQVAFPLLVSNLIDWLAPGAGSAVPAQLSPGAALILNAQEAANVPAITRPDGSTAQLAAENGQYIFTDTDQLGIYHLNLPTQNGMRQAAFAVNLFSPQESSLEPANNLPNVTAQGSTSGAGSEQARREWWRPLALLALGLLTGEWLVYQRAALIHAKDWLIRQVPGLRRKPAKQGIK